MTEPCLCLAVKSCSSEVSQHREGDSWFRNWDPNVHSPESWADLCLARGRLQTGNLESGHGLMPRTAEGEMLPDLTLKHQYWPEALGTLGQEEIPQRDSFGKDSLLLPGGMTRQPLREGAEEEASSGAKGRGAGGGGRDLGRGGKRRDRNGRRDPLPPSPGGQQVGLGGVGSRN